MAVGCASPPVPAPVRSAAPPGGDDFAAMTIAFASRAIDLLHGQSPPPLPHPCENFLPNQVHELERIDPAVRHASEIAAIVTSVRLWKPTGRADAFGVDQIVVGIELLTVGQRLEVLTLGAARSRWTCMDCESVDRAYEHWPIDELAPPLERDVRRLLSILVSPSCRAELDTELPAATCAVLAPAMGCSEYIERRRTSIAQACELLRGVEIDKTWSVAIDNVHVLAANGRHRGWTATAHYADEHAACFGGIIGDVPPGSLTAK